MYGGRLHYWVRLYRYMHTRMSAFFDVRGTIEFSNARMFRYSGKRPYNVYLIQIPDTHSYAGEIDRMSAVEFVCVYYYFVLTTHNPEKIPAYAYSSELVPVESVESIEYWVRGQRVYALMEVTVGVHIAMTPKEMETTSCDVIIPITVERSASATCTPCVQNEHVLLKSFIINIYTSMISKLHSGYCSRYENNIRSTCTGNSVEGNSDLLVLLWIRKS